MIARCLMCHHDVQMTTTEFPMIWQFAVDAVNHDIEMAAYVYVAVMADNNDRVLGVSFTINFFDGCE